MEQEELRAKLESYDLKDATLKQLITDRDFARDMYFSCTRKYRAVYNAIYNTAYECSTERPTRELADAATELLRAIRFEENEYYLQAERLGYEIKERLDKMDSNN